MSMNSGLFEHAQSNDIINSTIRIGLQKADTYPVGCHNFAVRSLEPEMMHPSGVVPTARTSMEWPCRVALNRQAGPNDLLLPAIITFQDSSLRKLFDFQVHNSNLTVEVTLRQRDICVGLLCRTLDGASVAEWIFVIRANLCFKHMVFKDVYDVIRSIIYQTFVQFYGRRFGVLNNKRQFWIC